MDSSDSPAFYNIKFYNTKFYFIHLFLNLLLNQFFSESISMPFLRV